LRKWLKNLLAVAILAALVWYLARNWQQVENLPRFGWVPLLGVYLVSLAGAVGTTLAVQRLMASLGTRTMFWDMFVLQNASTLLNYLPMKAGTVLRANYLKRRYGFSYTHFGLYYLSITLLMTLAASALGLGFLVLGHGLTDGNDRELAGLFLALLVASLVLLLAPLPRPRGPGRLRDRIRRLLAARTELSTKRRTMAECFALMAANFALSAVRLGIIYHALGVPAPASTMLILGSLAFVTMFVSLTPGALGLRELVLWAGAVVLDVPPVAGATAAMIDRAVALAWSFLIGGPCALWIWRKYPGDMNRAAAPPEPDTTDRTGEPHE
jgi:uncharacterized membrane protein YbhN (UPF0104 family)